MQLLYYDSPSNTKEGYGVNYSVANVWKT